MAKAGKFNGRECRKCGKRERYEAGGKCVNCRKLKDQRRKRRGKRTRVGITAEVYYAWAARLGGACEICHQVPSEVLAVDHCHKNGHVRGLLCRPCNSALGLFKDDPARLLEAIKYLAERG